MSISVGSLLKKSLLRYPEEPPQTLPIMPKYQSELAGGRLDEMIPALVAVVRNSSIVAGNEVKMTNEELEKMLQEVNEKLAKFGPENKLSNQEWRQYVRLKQEKDLLVNIQKCRTNGNATQEIKHLSQYSLMKDSNKMNPFLRYIMQLKLRSHIWG